MSALGVALALACALAGCVRTNAAPAPAAPRARATAATLEATVRARLDPKYAALTGREVYERGSPNGSGAARRSAAFVLDSSQWLGRTTAREVARLLEQLERGELASARSTAEMRRVLRQQLYASRLPQRVRFRGVAIGHKTGDWPPYLGNDVGIMYAPAPAGGPIVLAVFTNGNRGSFFDLEAAEGRIAEDVLDAWGR